MGTEFGKPLVSLMVVCYNQARFVRETLESVRAQTYKNTQLIIIDDCSTDDSVAIIEGWLRETGTKCTFIRHEKNQGICKTVNDALAHATGKYISMIASDDLWLPEKTERQVEIMESQPEDVAVLYSKAFLIDADGQRLPGMCTGADWEMPEMPEGRVLDTLLRGWFVLPQTALIRRSCYDKVGLYDENLSFEDRDMFLRIARHYSFTCSPLPTAMYRIHEASFVLSDPNRCFRDSLAVCFKHLRLGDLTEQQNSILTRTAVNWLAQLYDRNDRQGPGLLLALSKASGHKYLWWSCWLARLRLRCDRIMCVVRKYVWFPTLDITRGVRHSIGLNQANMRAFGRR
jgi:glycosyltransferase involved in cell wall biosynthesis